MIAKLNPDNGYGLDRTLDFLPVLAWVTALAFGIGVILIALSRRAN